MRKLRIHDAAAEEAAAAVSWYEQERAGLGFEFAQALEHALDVLEQDLLPLTAMLGSSGQSGVKRLLLRRFPFSIIVREYPSELIVVAIARFAKRPGYWRERLGG